MGLEVSRFDLPLISRGNVLRAQSYPDSTIAFHLVALEESRGLLVQRSDIDGSAEGMGVGGSIARTEP